MGRRYKRGAIATCMQTQRRCICHLVIIFHVAVAMNMFFEIFGRVFSFELNFQRMHILIKTSDQLVYPQDDSLVQMLCNIGV